MRNSWARGLVVAVVLVTSMAGCKQPGIGLAEQPAPVVLEKAVRVGVVGDDDLYTFQVDGGRLYMVDGPQSTSMVFVADWRGCGAN